MFDTKEQLMMCVCDYSVDNEKKKEKMKGCQTCEQNCKSEESVQDI